MEESASGGFVESQYAQEAMYGSSTVEVEEPDTDDENENYSHEEMKYYYYDTKEKKVYFTEIPVEIFNRSMITCQNYYVGIDRPNWDKVVDWRYVFSNQELPEWFVNRYKKNIDIDDFQMTESIENPIWFRNFKNDLRWEILSERSLPEKILEEFKDKVDWNIHCAHNKLSEQKIEKYADYIPVDLMVKTQSLSEEFLVENRDFLDWVLISQYQRVSEKFIEKFWKRLDKLLVLKHQKLSKAFVQKHFEDFPINNLLQFYQFDESELEQHIHLFGEDEFSMISKHQTLSESFMRKYAKKLNWKKLCEYQKLSENFIEDHIDEVDMDLIFEFQVLSNEFNQVHMDDNRRRSMLNKMRRARATRMLPPGVAERLNDQNEVSTFVQGKRPNIGGWELNQDETLLHRDTLSRAYMNNVLRQERQNGGYGEFD